MLFIHGEMSEWLKEPVLKTGDAQASVGSNPTLSATPFTLITNMNLQKYPRGRRGSPAKGVGCLKNAARVQIPPSAPIRRKRHVACDVLLFLWNKRTSSARSFAPSFRIEPVAPGLDSGWKTKISKLKPPAESEQVIFCLLRLLARKPVRFSFDALLLNAEIHFCAPFCIDIFPLHNKCS